jgi:hypothetical protein
MSFSKNGYEVIRNVISEDLLNHLKIEFQMIRDLNFFYTKEKNKFAFGDDQSPNSFSIYAAPFFESLAIQLKDKISEVVNLDLYSTYTYARIYYNGAILDPHTDRPSCEYSTTLCIDSTDIWDLYIKNKNGKENVVKLNPGDMCVYSGCELEHWRKPYEGKMQMQCFLHYVNSEGPYGDHKYDKRPMMGIGTKVSKETIKNKFNYQ